MDYKATIKPFILSNFLFTDDDAAVADDTSLIRGGIVDSTGILELIEFIESAYDIRVAPEEMVPAHFDTIDSIGLLLGHTPFTRGTGRCCPWCRSLPAPLPRGRPGRRRPP